MFLSELKSQTEKEAFISLSYLVAKADGCFGYCENALINSYAEEMGSNLVEYRLQTTPLIGLCRCFSTERSRQIVFVNLLSLACIDGCDNEAKRYILGILQGYLSINADLANRYQKEMEIIQGHLFPDNVD